jgi:hypothetical protein
MWNKIGCTKTLSEGEVGWWRQQSKEVVESDINKGYAAITNCRGDDRQNTVCHGAEYCDRPSDWQFYGAWIGSNPRALAIRSLSDGTKVYITEEAPYTKMVSSRGEGKYYVGKAAQFNPGSWGSYSVAPRGVYNVKKV